MRSPCWKTSMSATTMSTSDPRGGVTSVEPVAPGSTGASALDFAAMVGEVSRIANEFFSGLPARRFRRRISVGRRSAGFTGHSWRGGSHACCDRAACHWRHAPAGTVATAARWSERCLRWRWRPLGRRHAAAASGCVSHATFGRESFSQRGGRAPGAHAFCGAFGHAHSARADVERGHALAQRHAVLLGSRGSSECSRRHSASTRSVCAGSVCAGAFGTVRARSVAALRFVGIAALRFVGIAALRFVGIAALRSVGIGSVWRASATWVRRRALGSAVCA